jgi:hypothetical protein
MMLRKLTLAFAAAAALGTAAMAPTTASAWGGWHGGWHHGWGGPVIVGAPVVYGAYDGCMHRRWVPTPWGPRVRWVNVC